MIKGNRGLQNPVQNLLNCYAKPLSLTEGFMRETFCTPRPGKRGFRLLQLDEDFGIMLETKDQKRFRRCQMEMPVREQPLCRKASLSGERSFAG